MTRADRVSHFGTRGVPKRDTVTVCDLRFHILCQPGQIALSVYVTWARPKTGHTSNLAERACGSVGDRSAALREPPDGLTDDDNDGVRATARRAGSDQLTNVIFGTQPTGQRDHLRKSPNPLRPCGREASARCRRHLIGYGTRDWNPARRLAFRYRLASGVGW
ncbi:GGDEF family protein [Mycolicibacterium fortuitum subsp. acetamidolyticum]|uniref:GGDEF family protein n=1 Tax=Mycolicibacterium fortuitum subsp. acetamidolyticum TaxID=144550 RepID=A0A100WUY9_MYCFO|nr:GGDEF family protein [Mycolicibacterium fortuitum subsp. acetamidolyticum]